MIQEKTVEMQYASRRLTRSEKIFATSKTEEAAVIIELKTARHHLFGDSFAQYNYHDTL